MDELESLWRWSFDRYAELVEGSRNQAVRWEWASGQREDLRPYYFERCRMPRGKVVPEQPAERNGFWQYGYESMDRPVLARRFTVGVDYNQNPIMMALRGIKSVLQWSDQVFIYLGDSVQAVTFSKFEPRMPVEVAVSTLDREGKAQSFHLLQMAIGPQIRARTVDGVWETVSRTVGMHRLREEYTYEDGLLVAVRAHAVMSSRMSRDYQERLSYDGQRLATVTSFEPDGLSRTVYQRAAKKQSIKAMSERVEQRLVQVIPEALAGAGIRERAFCLVLIYHDQYAPPALVVGLEKRRQDAARSRRPEDRLLAYMPVKPWIAVQDPGFEKEYSLYEQQITLEEGYDTGLAMLRKVASELSRRDWTGSLDVTPDFVVYAADYEIDDIAQAIAASNPAGRVAQLRSEGWIQ